MIKKYIRMAVLVLSILSLAVLGLVFFTGTSVSNVETTFEVSPEEIPETDIPNELLGHLNIHLEPIALEEIPDHYKVLVSIVEMADKYDQSLNIHISSTWAEYFLNNKEALAQVRNWEANGHMLGLHHHGFSHATWDGYTNSKSPMKRPDYQGNMEALYELVSQVSNDGSISLGSMTDEDTDWIEGLLYSTNKDKSLSKQENLLSVIKEVEYNGQTVLVLTKTGYIVGRETVDVSLEEIEKAIIDAQSDEYLGLVLSDENFLSSSYLDDLEDLFVLLDDYGVKMMDVESLLAQ